MVVTLCASIIYNTILSAVSGIHERINGKNMLLYQIKYVNRCDVKIIKFWKKFYNPLINMDFD